MSLPLDTHAALWFFQADSRLPATTRERIEEAGTAAHVSVASLWEIAVKVSHNKATVRVQKPQGRGVRAAGRAPEPQDGNELFPTRCGAAHTAPQPGSLLTFP